MDTATYFVGVFVICGIVLLVSVAVLAVMWFHLSISTAFYIAVIKTGSVRPEFKAKVLWQLRLLAIVFARVRYSRDAAGCVLSNDKFTIDCTGWVPKVSYNNRPRYSKTV